MSDNKNINIAGIDLGTTFSAMAILNTIGKPEIVPNADGERLTPSAVFFDEDNGGIVRIGIEAINSRHLNAERSVRWIKRHIGDPNYHKTIDGKKWSAVELSSLILKKLKQDFSAVRGDIDSVVISVPAHFDEIRRKATMDAGKMAGLNVIGIVNEPVAAALYYATTRRVCGNILVYDLGGGTFDITIMNTNGNNMDIICSQGEHELGGIDFDQKVLEILQQNYRDKYNCELIITDEDRANYEDEAEDIKKTLSRRPVARKMLYGPAGSIKIEITQQMFEDSIAELLSRTDLLLDAALVEANMTACDIDRIILVGGSTRIPVVQKRLEERFSFAPEITINVDECVALGAALHAGLTFQREKSNSLPAGIANGLRDIKLTDVCNHSFGTICAPFDSKIGSRVIRNQIILKKNTPLPCEVSQTFYTMNKEQKKLEVTVTQGEDTAVEYVNIIATHTIDLPPGRSAKRPIKVTYSYDVSQRMHCKFEDVESGKVHELDLSVDKDGKLFETAEKEHNNQLEALKIE